MNTTLSAEKKEHHINGMTGKLAISQIGEGRPLLCLHGWLDNGASFWPLAEALPGFSWLCVDFPGHGHSAQRPAGSVYHFTDYIADVLCVHKQLGLEKPVIIGHSMGAAVAALFAAIFPDKIDKLVLIDGTGPVSGEDKDGLQQLTKSLQAIDQAKPFAPRIYDSWNALIERRMTAGRIKKQNAELLLRRGCTETEGGIFVHSDNRLKYPSAVYMNEGKVLSIISEVKAQTLLITADSGMVVNSDKADKRVSSFANIETATISGGHHAHMDEPQQTAQHISRFLEN